VDGQGGNVGGTDDTADGQRGAELLAARLHLVAKERRRQRGVHESCRNEIHADRRQFKREVLRQGRKRRSKRRDECEAGRRAAAACTTHDEQRPSRANLSRGVPCDMQRQKKMRFDVTARLLKVEFRQRRVVVTRPVTSTWSIGCGSSSKSL
jgi:hypothetical protein